MASKQWLAVSQNGTPVSVSAEIQPTTQVAFNPDDLPTYASFEEDGFFDLVGSKTLLDERTEWRDEEYRHAYAEAAVEQGIAWQVRVNRERRGMTQQGLARMIGTRQSAISRMEDPEYGSHSLAQLLKVANAFDCALIVKLAPYSMLALESTMLSEDDLNVLGYREEISGEGR
jgi:transcriptional regulator with XRE-family HTH domain